MLLPEDLRHALRGEIEKTGRASLAKASAQLTEHYQAGGSCAALRTEAHRAAYLAVRLPAIYACDLNVFSEIQRLAPEADVQSMLDLGAGPGTALYAAVRVFPSLSQATMIEIDAAMVELGRRIGAQSSHAAIRGSSWLTLDIRNGLTRGPHDLVVASYVLGELARAAAERAVARAWDCTRQLLAIIEPGTVRGFAAVHAARSFLIGAGAHILAPCPHEAECPMAAAGDWCHFAQRVDRTSLHRQLKGGALGYEDEKFSYVVASRIPFPAAGARIVRHPQKHRGHVQLTLCAASPALEKRTIAQSRQQVYKAARKAKWGDSWDFQP